MTHQHEHEHEHHPKQRPKNPHTWKYVVVLGIAVVAIIGYVVSMDESLTLGQKPASQAATSSSAPAGR
jgi:hypothetical protein